MLSALLLVTAAIASTTALAAVTDEAPPLAAIVGAEGVPLAAIESRIRPELDRLQQAHDRQAHQLDFDLALARQRHLEEAIGALLDERVLDLEATATHTTPAALLAAQRPPAATEAEARALYDQHSREFAQPFAALQDTIRDYLDQQARRGAERRYLDSLWTKYHAASRLPPLRFDVAPLGPARGPADAPVTIVEFGDFECPFCGQMAPTVRTLLADYPTELRLVFRHLPLTELHPHAAVAASAAACAGRQQRFWDMHDALYADQARLDRESIGGAARRLGLDIGAFDDCIDRDAAGPAIAADLAAADVLGIAGTPAFFVNGRFLGGVTPLEVLRELVEDELRRISRPASGDPAPRR